MYFLLLQAASVAKRYASTAAQCQTAVRILIDAVFTEVTFIKSVHLHDIGGFYKNKNQEPYLLSRGYFNDHLT
jgi:nucleoid DNA-binding protein